MTCNKKAASPFQAGTLGETASKTTVHNRNTTHTFRQQINQIVVMLAARGLLPVRVAEWLIHQGESCHV